MSGLIGERLEKKGKISRDQLQKALERQRIHGGRLGHNLIALGFLSEDELSSFFEVVPEAPKSVEESGLSLPFIKDLILKHGIRINEFTITEMGIQTGLSPSIVDKAIEALRKEFLIEVKGAGQITKFAFRFALTDAGKKKAADRLKVSRYTGKAPVPLDQYRSMVEKQTVKSIFIDQKIIREAFAHIVVRESLLRRLGPAVSSGKEIFLYGPSGNGKTTIAETIGKVLPGNIYMPYAVQIYDEVITVFDGTTHVAAEPEIEPKTLDNRWILTKRPVVMVGGEMTLKGLDLDFNPISKYYEAPLQMKANNGLFIVDDFGRQQVDPRNLLNRWIVPLERRTDFLTLQTGVKIEIPFDQLVVFSTNLEPRDLVDEAFLRRIRYKIKIDHPELNEYREIFKRVCNSNSIEFREDPFDYLIEQFYKDRGIKFNSCHCRDIIDNIIDDAHYHGIKPELTKEAISSAWESYFVKM